MTYHPLHVAEYVFLQLLRTVLLAVGQFLPRIENFTLLLGGEKMLAY
jgi:hypothetical protein